MSTATAGLLRSLPPRAAETLLAPHRPVLAAVLPELASPGTSMTSAAPEGDRLRLLGSLVEVLLRAAAAAPVLLVVEDVHWIDRKSGQVLDLLGRQLTLERILLIVTRRDDEVLSEMTRDWLVELRRLPRARQLQLHGLDPHDAARLLTDLVDSPVSSGRSPS